jgi:hypothetical protein
VWRGPLAGRGPDGLVPTPDQQWIMVLGLSRTPALDLDAMLTIEIQCDRRRHLCQVTGPTPHAWTAGSSTVNAVGVSRIATMSGRI